MGDLWGSYFYLPPDDGTLRNLLDERDRKILEQLEYVEVFERARELSAGEVVIEKTFDAAHLKAIHRHLFQNIYDWAGKFRTVDISKGGPRGFAELATGEVEQYLADANRFVTSADWGALNHKEFSEKSAEIFAYINQAHPFREGNGRTSRILMEHLASTSKFEFDWSRVSKAVWDQASLLSGPDLYSYTPDHSSLMPVFMHITAPARRTT